MDLPTWEQLAGRGAGVVEYLSRWSTPLDRWRELEYLAYVFNAITCAQIADAMIEPAHRSDWAAGVRKRLLEALTSRSI